VIAVLLGVTAALAIPALMVIFDNEYGEIAPRIAKVLILGATWPMPRRLRVGHRSVLLQDLDEAVEAGAGGVCHGAGLAVGAVRQVPGAWRARAKGGQRDALSPERAGRDAVSLQAWTGELTPQRKEWVVSQVNNMWTDLPIDTERLFEDDRDSYLREHNERLKQRTIDVGLTNADLVWYTTRHEDASASDRPAT
jgi:hypothetical protein